MLRSLSSRLLLAFAFISILSLALSALGTLFLLRDQQQSAAEERVGRLAEPLTMAVALLEAAGEEQDAIENAVIEYARSFDVRVLLVNEQGQVLLDSDSRLTGQMIDAFRGSGVPVVNRGGAQFRMAKYGAEGEDLLLFAPPHESLQLSSNRLVQVQTLIYELSVSGERTDAFDELVASLLSGPDTQNTLPLPALRPLVAVQEGEITSAWRDLIPQLAIAGGIALLASVVAAAIISRSVSGRLARVTRAAQEMARGNYDQQLDLRGEDEVGRLAQAFNVMARQVSRSHQTMRDLLANVSHELKTPLTSIQGFSQAMEEGAVSSSADYKEAGRIINEETQRMRRLVDDLIELSRLESGQALVERERIDLDRLLRVCVRRFEWQLRDSGAELKLDVGPLPEVEGDERRLEQVFTNLIDNAVRHAKGGEVTVRAETQNGVVRVGVHNTGSYIPPDELGRVFERFFQLDRARSAGIGGAGLGLAIASEVVQAHRGDISAKSDRDEGTEFVVTLPVSAGPAGKNGRSDEKNG